MTGYLGRTFVRTVGPGGGSRPPRTPPIASAFGDTDGEFFGRFVFLVENFFGRNFFRPIFFRPKIFSAENVFSQFFFGRFFFFVGGVWGGGAPFSFNHFKKFARRANFLKWCRGGVWGGEAPLRNLRYPCLAPVPCPQFTRTIYAYDLRVRFTNLRVRN